MNDNKYTESDIRFRGKFAEKIDHFWFYYKWHTIIALFVVFVLVVCISQSCSKQEADMHVLYAGPYMYSDSEKYGSTNNGGAVGELNALLPRDYNGDGEKVTGLITYQVMTKEQIEKLKEEVEENNAKPDAEIMYVDTSYLTSQNELYTSALMTGEYAILLVDEAMYYNLEKTEGRLRKLSDVFASVPANAMSEYGIRFSETSLYKNSEYLSKLPESTVLCLLSPLVYGATSNKSTYAQMTDMFIAMAQE